MLFRSLARNEALSVFLISIVVTFLVPQLRQLKEELASIVARGGLAVRYVALAGMILIILPMLLLVREGIEYAKVTRDLWRQGPVLYRNEAAKLFKGGDLSQAIVVLETCDQAWRMGSCKQVLDDVRGRMQDAKKLGDVYRALQSSHPHKERLSQDILLLDHRKNAFDDRSRALVSWRQVRTERYRTVLLKIRQHDCDAARLGLEKMMREDWAFGNVSLVQQEVLGWRCEGAPEPSAFPYLGYLYENGVDAFLLNAIAEGDGQSAERALEELYD